MTAAIFAFATSDQTVRINAAPFDLVPILININSFPGFPALSLFYPDPSLQGSMVITVFIQASPFDLVPILINNNSFPGFSELSLFYPDPSLQGSMAIIVFIQASPFDSDACLLSLLMGIELSMICVPFELAAWMEVGEFGKWKALSPIVTYKCILTGAANGLPDVEIPISSFQIRKRVM